MSKLLLSIFVLLFVIISVGSLQAQTTNSCNFLIDTVTETAQAVCNDLNDNEVCHAISPVKLSLSGVGDTEFNEGDILTLENISTLSTTNELIRALGIAIANVPLNLPDGSVQFILFGQATITNLVEKLDGPTITLNATNIAGYPVNLRDGAGTTFNVIGTMDEEDRLIVDGRNEVGDWFRVQTQTGVAWVYTSLVELDGDINGLTVLDSPYTAQMQNIILSAPIDDTACSVATSGLLLQYIGDNTNQMGVNGVDLKFSDTTLLLQAAPSEALNIQVIAGSVTVTSLNTTREATMGQVVSVKLNEELVGISSPSVDGDYDFANIAGAPVSLLNENTLTCVAGIGYGDEVVSIYGGPSDEYSFIKTLDIVGHYNILGYAENNDQLWWKVDTRHRQSWVPQASVRTAGLCQSVEVAEIPQLLINIQSDVNVNFVPSVQSVWQADSGPDILTGDCSNSAPLAVCSHLAAVIPQPDGSILWRGQEPTPFAMQQIGLNTFFYQGRNFQNNGNLTMNLNFVSTSRWNLTYSTVYDNAPDCTHTFYYTGVPRQ